MSWRRCILCIGLALAAGPLPGDEPPPQRVDLAQAGWPVGEFALADQLGRAVTQETLQGQWTFLLFTADGCSEPCAGALTALSGLYRRIARATALRTTQVIVVSLDPHLTPDELYGHLVAHDPRFVAAGGPPAALAALTRDLGAPNAPGTTSAEGESGAMWLIDPGGVIRARLLPPYDVPRLTATYLRTRASW